MSKSSMRWQLHEELQDYVQRGDGNRNNPPPRAAIVARPFPVHRAPPRRTVGKAIPPKKVWENEKNKNNSNNINGDHLEEQPANCEFWRCRQCTMENENLLRECSVCSAPRPDDGNNAPTFICAFCTYVNADSDAIQCEMCGTKRILPSSASPPLTSSDGSRTTKFVLGEEPPPPLKRKMLIREHRAFLAGIEESFGTIHVNPSLLRGIENLSRQPFELLQKQFEHPVSSSSSSSSLHPSPVIPSPLLDQLLKAVVLHSCRRAVDVFKTLQSLMACSDWEEDELRKKRCDMCGKSGEAVGLHYSDNCRLTSQSSSSSSSSPPSWMTDASNSSPSTFLQHVFCFPCSHDYIMSFVESSKCQSIPCPALVDASTGTPRRCSCELDTKFIRRSLSQAEFKQYLDECFNALITSGHGSSSSGHPSSSSSDEPTFLHCPNLSCRTIMEVCPPHGLVVPDLIKEVDENGKQLTTEAWIHFSTHRVRCHACNSNFCSGCLVTPYHLGKTCAEHVAYASSRHCRYCSDPLTPGNIDPENTIPAFESICSSSACLEKRERACTEMLACGHACLGIRDELQHMPCLEAECIDKAKQSGDEKMKDIKCTKDDLCQICWVEELGSAPLLQLTSCPHIFHQHCVHEKLLKRWPGVRITFAFGECSLCKVPMAHPSTQFRAIRAPIDELYRSICQKAMARLAIEKMEKDQKLIDPQSRYYNQPLKYALDCFAYYNCYKCSNFYFGGRRDCEQNAQAENRPPEEFVCFNCADLKSVACKNVEHSEYQVWKCRFCCNIASWFCFGTTHFCESCHSDNPMERTRRLRSGFKQCTGPAKCPLKREHAPNGAEAECEFNLGCGACQEELCKLQAAREKEKLIEQKLKENSNQVEI